jgi:ubiquinone/menaquinone biosynthesis C-methylase UbiE
MSLQANKAMLNSSFSKLIQERVGDSYVISKDISDVVLAGNESFNSGGIEYRTQPIFGDELWLKLKRAGISPEILNNADVLEICAGTGFLTYHLLSRCRPKSLVVNDISENELQLAREFIGEHYSDCAVDWVLGDMHVIDYKQKFDLVIGNSFLHHFYDVPKVLARIASVLKPGGVFISLHEPTPMSTVLESSKFFLWPLAIILPKFINDIARERYKGQQSTTDLWLFEAEHLKRDCQMAGFKNASTIHWGLFRTIAAQFFGLHLSPIKPILSDREIFIFRCAINADAIISRLLPRRCFSALTLLCRR